MISLWFSLVNYCISDRVYKAQNKFKILFVVHFFGFGAFDVNVIASVLIGLEKSYKLLMVNFILKLNCAKLGVNNVIILSRTNKMLKFIVLKVK